MYCFALSGGCMPYLQGGHATISVPRSGPKYDERRLRFLYILQPLSIVVHPEAMGLVWYAKQRRWTATQGILLAETGTPVTDATFSTDVLMCMLPLFTRKIHTSKLKPLSVHFLRTQYVTEVHKVRKKFNANLQ